VLDWQVQVDGEDPPGWDRHRDGCWFPDLDHQEYLLPYFDVGDSPIDPYGATVFGQSDLQRLREHLVWSRSAFEGKSERWSLTEICAERSRTISLEREKVLAVLDKTLEMIEYALARCGTMNFYGD
jgi:hypothetical protein